MARRTRKAQPQSPISEAYGRTHPALVIAFMTSDTAMQRLDNLCIDAPEEARQSYLEILGAGLMRWLIWGASPVQ